jgi:hypothetical protein
VKWGARASRARRSASRRTLDAEAVRNGTLPTATGTVALPSALFSTSSVQHGGAELPLCPKIGAAQQRRLPRFLSGFDAAEVDSLAPARSALAGLHPAMRDKSFSPFPKRLKFHALRLPGHLSTDPSTVALGRVAQIEQERGQPCPRVANTLEGLQNLCQTDRTDSAVRAPGLWATRPLAKAEALCEGGIWLSVTTACVRLPEYHM